MTKYSKAVAQMRKEGIDAFMRNDGVFIRGGGDRYFELELSLNEVQKWADLYDEAMEQARIQEMRDTDPWVVLEEIARIFHNRGWDLGDSSSNDTDYIHSSDRYLELVYKAFNPNNKKQ